MPDILPRTRSTRAHPGIEEGHSLGVRFLSQEWADELKRRLNANATFTGAIGSQAVKIQQVITTPSGRTDYWLRIEGGTVDLGVGDVDGPDATITQDYDSAAALAQGQLNPVTAFMTGKIRIAGNMMVLMGLQNALSVLPSVMSEMDIDY
jgi:putative sterol carrier protein